MNNLRKSSLVAALAVGATTFAFAFGAFSNFLKAEMPKANKAFEAKNMGYFQAVSTPDFSYTDLLGNTQQKKGALAGLKAMFDSSQTIKVQTKLISVKENAQGGVCDLESKYDIVTKPGPDKKTHRMQMTSKTRETWVKQGRTYKLKHIKELKAESMMDGKPMPPPGSGG
jgi:hypothetical protein